MMNLKLRFTEEEEGQRKGKCFPDITCWQLNATAQHHNTMDFDARALGMRQRCNGIQMVHISFCTRETALIVMHFEKQITKVTVIQNLKTSQGNVLIHSKPCFNVLKRVIYSCVLTSPLTPCQAVIQHPIQQRHRLSPCSFFSDQQDRQMDGQTGSGAPATPQWHKRWAVKAPGVNCCGVNICSSAV